HLLGTAVHPPRASRWRDESLPSPAERDSPCSQGQRRAHPSAMTFSALRTGRSRNGSSRRTRSWISQLRRRIPRQSSQRQSLRQEPRRRLSHCPSLTLLLLTYLRRFRILLEFLMELRGRRTFERSR